MTTHDNHDVSHELEPRKRTPLPKLQIFIISLIQFCEPITATVIYPFIPQLIMSTGITGGDETRVGYFAGIIESLFFLSEGLTVYPWSLLSDKIGRRPVLLIAPLGLTFSMLGFGLSSSFAGLVVFRTLGGLCNGNIGVSKTMVAEITDATNMGAAFGFIPLMWSTGVTIAPLIGGILSNPTERYPFFKRWAIFGEKPYFLPCLVVASLCFTAFLVAFLSLKETSKILAAKAAKAARLSRASTTTSLETSTLLDGPNTQSYGSTGGDVIDSTEDDEKVYTIGELIRLPRLSTSLGCYMSLAFLDMCYSCLIPLIYSTSISVGGLNLEPHQIGKILSTTAIIAGFVQLRVTVRLMDVVGPRKLFIGAMVGISVATAMLPLEIYFAKRAGKVDAIVILCMAIQLGSSMSSYAAYNAMQVLIVDGSPNDASLATVNSIAQIAACGLRTLAPTFASSLYSVSLSKNLLGGNMVFVVLLGLLTLAVLNAFRLDKKMQKLH